MRIVSWKTLSISFVIFVLTLYLWFFGIIRFDLGAATSIIAIIGPPLADYMIKPKSLLSIEDIKITGKEIDGVKGYLVEARIVNKGKKICAFCGAYEKGLC